MIRLLACTALVTVMLALALVGVRAVGAQNRPQAVAILEAGSCAQPCWHGLQPGHTTFEAARALLQTRADVLGVDYSTADFHLHWSTSTKPPWRGRAFRWSSMGAGAIDFIMLAPPADVLRLGDAIAVFGEPLVSTLCWRFDNIQPNIAGKMPRPFLGAHIFFSDNVEVFAYSPSRPTERRFDPGMVVWSVTYNYPDDEPPYHFEAPGWRGFTTAADAPVC